MHKFFLEQFLFLKEHLFAFCADTGTGMSRPTPNWGPYALSLYTHFFLDVTKIMKLYTSFLMYTVQPYALGK